MYWAIFLIISSLLVDAVDEGTFQSGGSWQIHHWDCGAGNFIEGIQIRHTSSMVKWIDVKCTNEELWKGGAGAYNEGSLEDQWIPGNMGFCGLRLAFDTNKSKFRYMCFRGTNTAGTEVCYGDSDYSSELQTVMSCTNSPPGNYRPRLQGIDVCSLSGGNDGFRGFRSYWNQTVECSDVLYIGHESDSFSDLTGFYELQGYNNGNAYYKHNDDSLDYCLFYGRQAWRIGSCTLISNTAVIQIDISDAYQICPQDFTSMQNFHWHDSSDSTGWISNLYMEIHDTVPLSWGNSVGFWHPVQSGNSGTFVYSETQSLTYSSTSSHEFTESESSEFTSTLASSLTEGYELGVSVEFFDMGVSQQYSFASTLSESASETIVTGTTHAISDSVTDTSTQEITCSISDTVDTNFRVWLWTLYRAATNYADTGAYKSTCDYTLMVGTECGAGVPPNCPPGYCESPACMQCTGGAEPLRAVALMYDDYTGCFAEIGVDIRCALSKRDYKCCTKNNPCGEWEGDCDADSQCEGDLVCHQTNSIDWCLKADDPLVVGSRRRLSDADDEDHTTSVYLPIHTGCAQFFDEGHCSAGPLYQYCTWDAESDTCVSKDGMTDPDIDATYVYYAPEDRNYCGDDCPVDDTVDSESDATLHYEAFSTASEKIFKEDSLKFINILALFGLVAVLFYVSHLFKKRFGQDTYTEVV